jgi:hypothetical protein
LVDETGIYVRAMRGDQCGSFDIAHLDYASLMRWLRSGDGIAERTVALLLGHREGADER